MEFSKYQTDIFDDVKSQRHSLIVDAKAGSGKTTTMAEAMNHVHPDDANCALAFNKSIADVLKTRVPKHVDARTFNSLGFGLVKWKFKSEMNVQKSYFYLKQAVPSNYEDSIADLAAIMRHGKAWGVGVFQDNEEGLWMNLMSEGDFDIDEKLHAQAAGWLRKAYDRSLQDTDHMDFDDQILFPLYYDLKGKQFNNLFVDEAQDMSPLQHAFIQKFLSPSGRVIAFGDPAQAIYAFRGADTESMAKMTNMFQAEILPLSICYRCANSIIAEAQQIVPEIEARPDAPEGLVDMIDLQMPEEFDYRPDDLIICRNNAPLISLGLKFLAANKRVNVRGEFGAQLIKFIEKFKTQDITILRQRLTQWHDAEIAIAKKKEQWRKLHNIKERYEAIVAVLVHSKPHDTDALIKVFKKLFDSKVGTTLSSIHRAKGEEASRVFFLKPDLIPSSYANTPAQLQQEMNMKYVAITRAIDELHYTIWEN